MLFMSGKRSKNKGKSYERKIAAELSAAFPPFEFKRVPLSGGWDKSLVVGDIVPWLNQNVQYFGLSFECKNHRTLNLKSWLKQATEDTEGKLQSPVVVFHINRRKGFPHGEDFIAIEKDTLGFYLRGSLSNAVRRRRSCRRIYYKDFSSFNRWNLDEWINDTFAYADDNRVRALFLNYEGRIFAILRFRDFLGIIDKRRLLSKVWGALRKHLLK